MLPLAQLRGYNQRHHLSPLVFPRQDQGPSALTAKYCGVCEFNWDEASLELPVAKLLEPVHNMLGYLCWVGVWGFPTSMTSSPSPGVGIFAGPTSREAALALDHAAIFDIFTYCIYYSVIVSVKVTDVVPMSERSQSHILLYTFWI